VKQIKKGFQSEDEEESQGQYHRIKMPSLSQDVVSPVESPDGQKLYDNGSRRKDNKLEKGKLPGDIISRFFSFKKEFKKEDNETDEPEKCCGSPDEIKDFISEKGIPTEFKKERITQKEDKLPAEFIEGEEFRDPGNSSF
jgi:hypothetical protein